LLAEVLGLCRRVGWGERVFFVIVVRGHHKRTKRGKSRAPMAFWVQAVLDGAGGWQLAVSLEVLLWKLWQRWEVGFCWMKSGFGLGRSRAGVLRVGSGVCRGVRGCMGRWCGVGIVGGVGVGVVCGGLFGMCCGACVVSCWE